MQSEIKMTKAALQKRYGRTKNLLQAVPYLETLATFVGCKPNILSLLFSDPFLAFKVLFGPCVPATYRLHGPHPWPGARDAILSATSNTVQPTMTRLGKTLNLSEETKEPNNLISKFWIVGIFTMFLYLLMATFHWWPIYNFLIF